MIPEQQEYFQREPDRERSGRRNARSRKSDLEDATEDEDDESEKSESNNSGASGSLFGDSMSSDSMPLESLKTGSSLYSLYDKPFDTELSSSSASTNCLGAKAGVFGDSMPSESLKAGSLFDSPSAPREMDAQLTKLNGEIDGINAQILAEKAEWKTEENPDKAAVYLKSIEDLKYKEKVLIADRSKLLAAIAVPAPGKNTPLAIDAYRLPLYTSIQYPSLLVLSALSLLFVSTFSNLRQLCLVLSLCSYEAC